MPISFEILSDSVGTSTWNCDDNSHYNVKTCDNGPFEIIIVNSYSVKTYGNVMDPLEMIKVSSTIRLFVSSLNVFLCRFQLSSTTPRMCTTCGLQRQPCQNTSLHSFHDLLRLSNKNLQINETEQA